MGNRDSFSVAGGGAPAAAAGRLRSPRVTVLSWVVIGLSALAIPVSLISLLMVMAGSYGTANADFFGGLQVIGGPPMTLIAGIGLLRRKRWAYLYLVVVLAGITIAQGVGWARGPREDTVTVSAEGVRTTVLASKAVYSLPIIVPCVAALVVLLARSTRREFGLIAGAGLPPGSPSSPRAMPETSSAAPAPFPSRDPDGGASWRVGHLGRDAMFYEEWGSGEWRRLEIQGEMLMGRTHHVIYVPSPAAWRVGPEWARGRRDEILARIKSRLNPPDYEYQDVTTPVSDGAANPGATTLVREGWIPPASKRTSPRDGSYTLLALLSAFFLALAVGLFWFVQRGLTRGETVFPGKVASHSRAVQRQPEPVKFWFSIGLYGALGVGALGLGGWGVRETWRHVAFRKVRHEPHHHEETGDKT